MSFERPAFCRRIVAQEQTPDMYMQDKLGNARGIIYVIALVVLVVIAAWKLILR
jgi:hypothetical protein